MQLNEAARLLLSCTRPASGSETGRSGGRTSDSSCPKPTPPLPKVRPFVVWTVRPPLTVTDGRSVLQLPLPMPDDPPPLLKP
jgi:hypothetical protein